MCQNIGGVTIKSHMLKMPNAILPDVTLLLFNNYESLAVSHTKLQRRNHKRENFLGVSIVSKIFSLFQNIKIDINGSSGKITPCVLQKIGIIGSFFVYYFLSIYRNFSKKLKTNILSSWFSCIWNILKTSLLEI